MKKIISIISAFCLVLVCFCGCTKNVPQDTEQHMFNFFYEKTGNVYGAAAILANLNAESGLNPKNLQNSYEKKLGMNDSQYTQAVDEGTYTNFVKDSAGYGIAQWTFWSRKEGLLNYAQSVNKSIGDLDMQMEYLWLELQNYKSLLETLTTATDIKTASDKFLVDFERPASMNDSVKNKRASIAQTYYDRFAELYV